MRLDLFWLDHPQVFPFFCSIGKRVLRYPLKYVDFALVLPQLGYLTIVHLAVVKLDGGTELAPAEVQNDLLSMLWVFEFHPDLETIKSHFG